MPRDFRETINKIEPLFPVNTPNEDDDYSNVVEELQNLTSGWYKGAETDGKEQWMAAARILQEYLEDPPSPPFAWPEWKWQVLSIFTGIPFGD